MGMNYYFYTGRMIKKTCNLGLVHDIEERIHIGKLSCGWYFMLHVHPEMGINELEDWKILITMPHSVIRDEEDEQIDGSSMLKMITGEERTGMASRRKGTKEGDICVRDYFNGDILYGKNNLVYYSRDKVGKEGLYVLLSGDFS